jgi:hypothetical protein
MTATTDDFFKPGRISLESKLATTTTTAKAIIAKEAMERAEKSERLRAMRLAQSA